MDESPEHPGADGIRRRQLLRRWFERGDRGFQWRLYRSPWHVLLAEMLLLRTRADIVARWIPEILTRYPTPNAMAQASQQDVEDVLRPLGLRWRAHRLHELANVIVRGHHGRVPVLYNELIALPGVGPYVASVTLSALTGSAVLLTDTNTVRVAKRVAGLSLGGDVRRTRAVQSAIGALIGGRSVLVDWLAVVDLASAVCLPRNPRCEICPIRALCSYGLSKEPAAQS